MSALEDFVAFLRNHIFVVSIVILFNSLLVYHILYSSHDFDLSRPIEIHNLG